MRARGRTFRFPLTSIVSFEVFDTYTSASVDTPPVFSPFNAAMRVRRSSTEGRGSNSLSPLSSFARGLSLSPVAIYAHSNVR